MTNPSRRDNQACTSSHREGTLSRLRTWREGSTFPTAEAKNHPTVSGMEPLERQTDHEVAPAYFDPDAPDVSEQQFAASLEEEIPRPAFIVEATGEVATQLPDPPPSELEWEGRASRPSAPSADASAPPAGDCAPDWRNQVSAKVNHYKSRKAPKVRYPSLQLQFEPPPARVRGAFEVEAEFPTESATRPDIPQLQPTPEAFLTLEATARVIEFPRAPVAVPRLDELAEPVLDRPRIVEAPALLPPPPALGGILIEGASEHEPERRPGFDMPLQSAPLSRRLLAGTIDALVVATALAIFGYLLLRLNGPIGPLKLVLQIAAILLAILWPAYQYAFLVFTGSTPGLRLARLGIANFDGTPASRKLRRWRVLASLLSWVSLGLGYAWCFLDEDQLSWHDRITKTHLAPRSGDRY
jgi:uncharacterized RDD family membrane protein YckC